VKLNLDKAVAMLNDLHGGTTSALMTEINQLEKEQNLNVKPLKEKKVKPNSDYMDILRPMLKTPYPKPLRDFLERKNIPILIAQKFYCSYVKEYHFPRRIKGEDRPITARNALLLPVLLPTTDKKVTCVGAQVRPLSAGKNDLKYYSIFPFKSNRFFFGEHLLHRARRKKIFIVEGGLDTMHIWSEKHIAYGLMGLYMSQERILKLKGVRPRKIYVMLDPDQNMKTTAFKIQDNLAREGVEAEILSIDVDPKLLTKNDLDNF